MEMILTSSTVDGNELCRLGVVAKTFGESDVLAGAMACAHKIAAQSAPVVELAKQAILNGKYRLLNTNFLSMSDLSHAKDTPIAEQTDLGAGLKLERALYYSSFSLRDRTEGMAAFLEKRKPDFEHR
jgi:enoyl-CoA hydratase/carnithine racemase